MLFKCCIGVLGLVDTALFALDVGATYGEAGVIVGTVAMIFSLEAFAKFLDSLETREQ